MNILDWKTNQMNVNYAITLENFTYSRMKSMAIV